MSDNLYARFDTLREDFTDRPTAEPAALRRAARHRTRIRTVTVASAGLVAVAATTVVAAALGAKPSPPPQPGTTATASPTSAPTPTRGPACGPDDFTITVYGGDGHMGGDDVGFALANTGPSTCPMPGFVDLTFVDEAGDSLPTTIMELGTPTPITLRPGDTAYFEIGIGNIPVDNEKAPCEPPAAGLRVALPGGGSLVVPGPFRACGHGHVSLPPLHSTPNPGMHQ